MFRILFIILAAIQWLASALGVMGVLIALGYGGGWMIPVTFVCYFPFVFLTKWSFNEIEITDKLNDTLILVSTGAVYSYTLLFVLYLFAAI
jgi:hypothetical protein